jgi:bifunctional non-homologous end joining protein LigD
MTKESTTLYYREGSSDKIYQAALEAANGGFVVNFAYGRRGSTLQTGTKTQSPVPLAKAKRVFDNLIQSKMAKGYTPGEEGTPYRHTGKETLSTEIRPQLCNPIAAEAVKDYLADPAYWMQEKFDGKRILLRKDSQSIVGINRKGLVVGLPEPIVQAAQQYNESFLLDGECLGDVLYVFDLLALDGDSMFPWPYSKRLEMLQRLLLAIKPHLPIVPTAVHQTQKSKLLLKLRGASKEGVVFKRHDAPYTAGRPASGGTWLKYKFTATGSFLVSTINDKRSVGLEVCDGIERIQVGNVTVPANKKVPKLGDIIEVRYLYAFRGGSLFQPVFLHVRDDLETNECRLSQLKYKAERSDEEES